MCPRVLGTVPALVFCPNIIILITPFSLPSVLGWMPIYMTALFKGHLSSLSLYQLPWPGTHSRSGAPSLKGVRDQTQRDGETQGAWLLEIFLRELIYAGKCSFFNLSIKSISLQSCRPLDRRRKKNQINVHSGLNLSSIQQLQQSL